MNDICVSSSFSATMATAPLVCPVIFSPIIKSDVVADGPLIEERMTVGADAVDVFADSNIP